MNIQYENYLADILKNGVFKEDRTGTGTYSVFGRQMRFDLREGFPLITTKKVHTKSIIHELLWFLKGGSNIKYLTDNGVTIWNEWADENGDLGPVYGKQWRSWPDVKVQEYGIPSVWEDGTYSVCAVVKVSAIDQIQQAIDLLKNNPDSRRIVVSAWNPAEIPDMKLPPCHAFFQFYTEEIPHAERWVRCMRDFSDYNRKGYVSRDIDAKGFMDDLGMPTRYLSCQLYQRSADSFLGVPFNIASYALLTEMFAQQANMVAKDFVWTGGDCHVYSNHVDQVKLQLTRDVRSFPKLRLNKAEDIFSYKFDDITIEGYDPHPAIKGAVAV